MVLLTFSSHQFFAYVVSSVKTIIYMFKYKKEKGFYFLKTQNIVNNNLKILGEVLLI